MPVPMPLLRAHDDAERRALGALCRLEVKLDVDGKAGVLDLPIGADAKEKQP